MPDREKVIKGLQHCVEKLDTIVNKRHGFNCVECPYYRKCENIGSLVGLPLMRDALALLKAQEAKRAIIKAIGYKGQKYGVCPHCGRSVDSFMNTQYCGFCGKAVKWE